MIEISPSILAADFSNLKDDISRVTAADYLHLDVMDGSFVPGITFGADLIAALRPHSQLVFDTHLMIRNPARHIEDFARAGSDLITVHAEAALHLHRVIQKIKETGCGAGVALNPATSLSNLDYVLPELDLVLIMSVNPGAGGQKFIPQIYGKIEQLAQIISDRELDVKIAVDGGIGPDNIKRVAEAGARIIVAGSAIFGSQDPSASIKEFKEAVNHP